MSVKVAGKQLSDSEFKVTNKKLTIPSLPSGSFEVEIETDIKPQVLVSFGLQLYCIGVFITLYSDGCMKRWQSVCIRSLGENNQPEEFAQSANVLRFRSSVAPVNLQAC